MTETDEGVRKRLSGRGGHALERHGDGDVMLALARDLFARTGVEDLAVYSADEIAAFVESAYAALAARAPGHEVVRVGDPALPESERHGPVTVVEIVNDNMPFLFDSVLGELQDFGAAIRLVAHPIVTVERDAAGKLIAYRGTGPAGTGEIRESLIQIHIDRLVLAEDKARLVERLDTVLADVRRAVTDWRPMLQRLDQAVEAYRTAPPPIPAEDIGEAIALLEWLREDNFTFLGMREYDFVGGAARGELHRADRPGLGILSDPSLRVLSRGEEAVTTTPSIRQFLARPEPLIIAKANAKSRVHRRAYLDYVGIKLYGRKGTLAGELRVVGLFTSTAYTRSVRAIPYLRRKAANVLARAGYDPASHSGKALLNVIETYPRDELFQLDEDTLYDFATAILALEERPRVRILSRRDEFDRFVSVIVYVPRDRYDSDIRVAIGDYLAGAYDGHVSAFYPAFPEGALTRVHFIIGRAGGPTPNPERATLEAAVERIIRDWADGLDAALATAYDPAPAKVLSERYRRAFPAAYRDDFTPEAALDDITLFERLRSERPLAIAFHPIAGAGPSTIGLKLVHLRSPVALSERVPMLENMGFRVIDERSYEMHPADADPIHLHDMVLESMSGRPIDLAAIGERLTACFTANWYGHVESDGYDGLVLNAGLAWRDIALLRTLSRYLRQAGIPYSQNYMWATLNRHSAIAGALVELFHDRFAPGRADADAADERLKAIEASLESVESLDEDRIIRRFANLIGAMVRTNFFQLAKGGLPADEIAMKLDSGRIDGLPRPRPFREVFLYSPRLEAVHLRFGRVARGGIRWSDRPQDFRTEILGLAKAQQVKNAVIVPVGAKGGFVPKKLPAVGGRDADLAEGTEAYRTFIGRLLDITDNLDGERVVPPEGVVRHDGDDPYLVVAADKGTATFSDLANAIALDRHFWLGDAFASGGSAGYDHKKMGITARGAWEAVKRHFREMDVDIETTPFTVAGVGDMSGDVFGNGMLLSPATKLVAAFDHRDIFLDPNPDPETSLAERRRLFELPRSGWQDYDRAKISRGGGVFSRREKAIKLTREVKALLGLAADQLSPQELIQAILKAEIDLLWFGGVGTFVRAPGESDDAVGDRANDAIRVTAADLRARVVGEGANLAMTQRARVEYGLRGGCCNSDAIDNSAGVNTSDVEVNIKIALDRAVTADRLDLDRRNRLLKAMTDEVASLVLRNNYLQPLAISLSQRRGFEDFDFQRRLMKDLEARGILDRAVETLPDDAALAERQAANEPLTRAEIAILLAYAKLTLGDDLEASDVLDDPALAGELLGYFPKKMRTAYRGEIEAHRLRREIIATRLANAMINRGGPTYLVRVADRCEATPGEIARAYLAAQESFALDKLNAAIDALDGKVSGTVQLDLYRAVEDLLHEKTVWFARNVSFAGGIGAVAAAYGKTVAAVARLLDAVLPAPLREAVAASARAFEEAGVPAALARRIAQLASLAEATDIHLVAEQSGAPIERVAAAFFAIADRLGISRIVAAARRLPLSDRFDRLAIDRALDTLADARRRIATEALLADKEAADPLGAWISKRTRAVERILATVTTGEAEELSVARVTVAADLLADLARGSP